MKEISIDVIQKISGFAATDYDFSKIKLNFFKSSIPGLNGFAVIDSIYVSYNQLRLFNACMNKNCLLDSNSNLTIFENNKLNCLRLVQHEIAHVVLADIADDVNISVPDIFTKINSLKADIEESGLLAEIEHFGGRINWIKSSESNNLDINYCKYYIKKVEDNEFEKFDCNKAKVELYSDACMTVDISDNIPICMTVDISDNNYDLIIFE